MTLSIETIGLDLAYQDSCVVMLSTGFGKPWLCAIVSTPSFVALIDSILIGSGAQPQLKQQLSNLQVQSPYSSESLLVFIQHLPPIISVELNIKRMMPVSTPSRVKVSV